MMTNDGWIALYRKMLESPLWREDPNVLKLFIYLVLKARHSHEPKRYPGFEVKRGELVTSLSMIAEENEYLHHGSMKQWSRQKVSRMIETLEKGGYIQKLPDTYGTHIRVCNYSTYQDVRRAVPDSDGTGVEQEWNASGTQVGINNNVNNGNNGNNGNHENNSLDGETDRPARPEGDAGSSEAAPPEHVYLNSLERVDFEHMKGWRVHEIERVEVVAALFGRMYLHRFERPHHPIKREAWELATSKLRATLMSGVAEVVEWEDVIEQYLSEWNGESPTTGEKRNPNFEAFCGPRMITNLINHMSEER